MRETIFCSIQIEAERLGTVSRVKDMLIDLEATYNSLFAFYYIADSLKYNIKIREIDYVLLSFLGFQSGRNDIEKLILPEERLRIRRINIQSLGFWDFMGVINPLEQIRRYLNDRHERKKDKEYRNRQEEKHRYFEIMMKEHSLLHDQIELLRNIGVSQDEIRRMVMLQIVDPLYNLGQYQDSGQIGRVGETKRIEEKDKP